VTEGVHPALSKPLGADSSKSGDEGRFGWAVSLGRGFGAGRAAGDGWTAPVGAGVAGSDVVALAAATRSCDADSLVGAVGLGRAGTIGAVAAARSSSARRMRSAGTALSPRRGGATACRTGAGAAGRGAVRVAAATTA
jgi:hypothetical protein